MSSKKYRLALDLGSTSLGWALLSLDDKNEPEGFIDFGVRIVPDGREDKTKKPLAVGRRENRGASRNEDRYLLRIGQVTAVLLNLDLLPEKDSEIVENQKLDPYMLRTKALNEKLTKFELGRAIMHLCKKRGFKSNRKVDGASKDSSKMKDAIKRLKASLESSGARTIGEYLHNLNSEVGENEQHLRKPVKFVNYTDKESGIFPDRELVIDEFDRIMNRQKSFYSELTEDYINELKNAIFFQRPLKAQPKGKCIFLYKEGELRCPKASPYFQKFDLLQRINNLRYRHKGGESTPFTPEEKKIIFSILNEKAKVTIGSFKKKIFKEDPEDYSLNIPESDKDIRGNDLNAKMSAKKVFGNLWLEFTLEEQERVIRMLINENNDPEIEKQLGKFVNGLDLSNEQKEVIIETIPPAGYGNLSLKAIKMILPYLEQGQMYSEACASAGFNHSGELVEPTYINGDLPYYGKILRSHVIGAKENPRNEEEEFGKIPNATVHIVLNQLRKLMNAIVVEHGKPEQIVVEVARDLPMGEKSLNEMNKTLASNKKRNEQIVDIIKAHNAEVSRENIQKYKLWEELNKDELKRCCIYTGKPIPIHLLFTDEIEIEHILPFSQTYNDSMNNKTVSYKTANRYKGNRTPFDAFGESPSGYNYYEIMNRAMGLVEPQGKKHPKWHKFAEDAMERYKDEEEILARMLNDTRYICRIAREYLSYVVGHNNIWTVKGEVTSKIRVAYGLNKILNDENVKTRDDHRHHAVDAVAIGLTSRSMVKKFSTMQRREGRSYIKLDEKPFENFNFVELRNRIKEINVSYKPDHLFKLNDPTRKTTGGQLHKDTAYGDLGPDPDKKGNRLLTERKNVTDLKQKDIENVKSKVLRQRIYNATEYADDWKSSFLEFCDKNNIRKLKLVLSKSESTLVRIEHGKGHYKYFVGGNNYCADVFKTNKGKNKDKWNVEVISMFDAHKKDFIPQWKKDYPMGKRLMRLFKGDTVKMFKDEKWGLYRVVKFSGSEIAFVKLNHVQKTEKIDGKVRTNLVRIKGDSLRNAKVRKVYVDIRGRVLDHKGNKKGYDT